MDINQEGDGKASRHRADELGAGALEVELGQGAELRKLEFKMEDRLARQESLVYSTLDEMKGRGPRVEPPLDKLSDRESDLDSEDVYVKPRSA